MTPQFPISISLRDGDEARSSLTRLGWLAQLIAFPVVEVTGHFFISANQVTLTYGKDVIASWADALPRLVEVNLKPGTNVSVKVAPNGVLYSAAGVIEVSPTAGVLPTRAPVVPNILGSSGYVFSDVRRYGATAMASDVDPVTNSQPWLYFEGSLEIRTSIDGIPLAGYDPATKMQFVSSAAHAKAPPIPMPLTRFNSNINVITAYSTTTNFLNSGSAGALYTNGMQYICMYCPTSVNIGTNRQPWYCQGTIGQILPPTDLYVGFLEVPETREPYRSYAAAAANSLPSAIRRALLVPMIGAGIAAPNYGFRIAAYCPNWEPAGTGSIVAAVLSGYYSGASFAGSMNAAPAVSVAPGALTMGSYSF